MAAPRGLSVDDIETLRSAVESGRRPKVVFTAAAGQIAGQTGQVTAVGDPADGDEYISVRFGRDKLEFAPTDLQLPGKAGGRRAKPAAARRAPAEPPTSPSGTGRTGPSPTTTAPPTSVGAGRGTATAAAAKPATDRATTASAAPPARSVRRGRGKSPAELSVTLSWQDGDWSVQAHRGSRVVAKPTPVRAADALKMVEMLDTPAVSDAVGEIVAAARDAAAERAEQLRRELAEVEARLAELPQIS